MVLLHITNVISWPNQVRYNEPKFVISEACGEPANSPLCLNMNAPTCTPLSPQLALTVLLPLATYYVPTTYYLQYYYCNNSV